MVYIFTLSDKCLIGKQINNISAYFAETLFKHNYVIAEQKITSSSQNISAQLENKKSGDICLVLVERSNLALNSALAKIANCEIKDNEYIKNNIYEYYRKRNLILEKESENEWKIPEKARAIINPNNITQGYMLNIKDVLYFVLPLSELDSKQMFDNVVLDTILASSKKKYKNHTFKTFGISANSLQEILKEQIKNKDKVSINLFEKNSGVDIILKSHSDNEHIDDYARKIFIKLNNYIYSVEDIAIEKVAYDLINMNNIKIAFAETITGGKCCYNFVSQAPNAKNLVASSIVACDKQGICSSLGIDEKLFEQNGEVSVNCVHQMALNLILKSNADIVVASVGNLDENNGSNMGLSYIAVGDKKEIHIYKNIFNGSHKEIIDNITIATYFYLIKKLKKNDFHFEKTIV